MNQTGRYATPFYLIQDKSNKYRIDENLKKTVDNKEMIPFLRTNDDEYWKVISKGRRSLQPSAMGRSYYNEGSSPKSPMKTQYADTKSARSRIAKIIRKKEDGWN